MTTFDGRCPLCRKEITDPEQDVLMIEWSSIHKHWVVRHLKRDEAGRSIEPYTILNKRYQSWCGRARFNPATGHFE